MARAALPKTDVPTSYASAGAVVTYTAANTTDKNSVTITGNEIVLATNTDTGAHTVTINSAPDPKGRTKDTTAESIAAGATHVYQRFPQTGYRQTDGTLHLEASHATVKFAVLKLRS